LPIPAPLHERGVTAPVSHQKRRTQSATNAIEFKRKDSKINEPDRYSAAHNDLVAASSPDEPFTISVADHLRSGEGFRRNWKSGTSPFTRFGIQFYHALLTTILLRHRQLHHMGMIKSSDALFIGRCARQHQGGA
jgi:hypothetical protein